MGELKESDIRKQSLNCYNQWAPQWREQAKVHGDRFEMHDLRELHNTGVGKAALCIANGYSFEEKLDVIKKNQDNVDVVACDKTIGNCLDNGIIPKYAILCDANVSYEKYLEPWKDKLQDTILIANVCAATKWATLGNWKKKYFFINKDVLQSEEEFSRISGCKNKVVAGTNVSNAMIIMLTQCDDKGKRNVFGYDKILMIGFDYSWKNHYYAFDHDGGGKINYMKTVYGKNLRGEMIYSSSNLIFSAKWLDQYFKVFKINAIQCSGLSIMRGKKYTEDLENQMKYLYRPEDSQFLQNLVKIRHELRTKLNDVETRFKNVVKDHNLHVFGSI